MKSTVYFDWKYLVKAFSYCEVGPTTGCWMWKRFRTAGGYPTTKWKGCSFYTHRLIYLMMRGEIAEGMTLDHLCGQSGCVNPLHLEEVTIKVNIQRARAKIVECPKGHEYNKENTLVSTGKRHCRECMRANTRRYNARKRQQK